MNQQVATELLESAGAIVTIANHGGEAVKILTQAMQPPPFDVVFMDLQMPEMDGFTATKLLRADHGFKLADHRDDGARTCRGAPALPRCGNERSRHQADRSRRALRNPARAGRSHMANSCRETQQQNKDRDEMIIPRIEGVDVVAGLIVSPATGSCTAISSVSSQRSMRMPPPQIRTRFKVVTLRWPNASRTQ